MSFWSELQTLRHFLLPFIFDSRDLTPKFAVVYFMPEAHRHPSLKSLRFFSFLGLTFSTREMPLQPRWWHWSSKPMPVSWPLPQWLSTCVKTAGKSTHHSHFWDANECKWLHATSQMKGAPWQSNLCFWIFIGSSEKKKKTAFLIAFEKPHLYCFRGHYGGEDNVTNGKLWYNFFSWLIYSLVLYVVGNILDCSSRRRALFVCPAQVSTASCLNLRGGQVLVFLQPGARMGIFAAVWGRTQLTPLISFKRGTWEARRFYWHCWVKHLWFVICSCQLGGRGEQIRFISNHKQTSTGGWYQVGSVEYRAVRCALGDAVAICGEMLVIIKLSLIIN